ncbi:MAG: ABC transporter ATP-binding protein, partial [Lachnospiraceae bacterium]|nr:ABC transporter ATP-binding protein [Lachnospiraceae bacterium]
MAKRNTYFQDEVIRKKFDIRQFGRILRYMKPYSGYFILVGVLMLVSAGLAMITPLLLKEIINNVVVTEDYRLLTFIVSAMAVIALLEICVNFVHQRIMGIVGHKIICDVRKEIFYKLQELPFDYFDSKPNGKIVVRVTDYVNDLANFFSNYVLNLLSYLVKLIIVTFFMLGLSPILTGIVFMIVIPMMVCIFTLRYFIRKEFAKLRAKNSNRSAFVV